PCVLPALRRGSPSTTRFPYTTLFRSGPTRRSFSIDSGLRSETGVRSASLPSAFGSRPVQNSSGLWASTPRRQRELFCTGRDPKRSEEHTSELQSRVDIVCRLLREKKS